MELLPYMLAARDGLFVDVGGHVGTRSFFASFFFESVVAFEPEKRNQLLFAQTLKQNGSASVRVVDTAISDHEGTATFHVLPSANTGRNSLMPLDNALLFEVPVTTLDKALAWETLPVRYLKVDVEGLEPHVLLGFRETLTRMSDRPVIEVEFAPFRWKDAAEKAADARGLLRDCGYTPLIQTNGFLAPLPWPAFDAMYEAWSRLRLEAWLNIIFVTGDPTLLDGRINRAWNDVHQLLAKPVA